MQSLFHEGKLEEAKKLQVSRIPFGKGEFGKKCK
jgi:hypothetical protein